MTTRPELTAVFHPNGLQRYADAGAAQQGGNRPIKRCTACGMYVVFVQSTKTGKWYLADCARYSHRDAYYYVKASPHHETCGRVVAERRANEARSALSELHKVKTAEMFATTEQIKHLGLAADQWQAEFDARFYAVEHKYADEIARLRSIIEGTDQ